MNKENKTLWGFPIVETEAMPQGEIVFGRLPTPNEIREHGSLEKAVQHMKNEYHKLKLNDETLNTAEVG